MEIDLKPDDKFETFLDERTTGLDERRRRTVKKLARHSFYGHAVFARLYPAELSAPPDVVHRDAGISPTVARPRFQSRDVRSAERIRREFVKDNWDRFQHYASVEMMLHERR